MPYIDRNKNKEITGIFIPKQYPNQEYLPDSDPEVIAFRTSKPIKKLGLAMIFDNKENLLQEFNSANTLSEIKECIRKILFEGELSGNHK